MVTNKQLLLVYGMKRSGNHAIISWIRDNYGGVIIHLNNILTNRKNPYRACEQIHIKGVDSESLRWLPFGYRKNVKSPDHIRSGKRDWILKRRKIRNITPKDLMVLSYENKSPRHYAHFQADYPKYIGNWEGQKTIFILRDPLNLLASLIKSERMVPENETELIEVYKEHAKIIQSEDFINDKNCIFINYNKWFLEPEYRISIAEQIGFKTSGEAYLHVPMEGRGSSFDSRSADGAADKMQVLDRWNIYHDNDHFKSLFDDELIDISRSIFDMDADFFSKK